MKLADAMEILPRYLDDCSDQDLAINRFVLQNYLDQFPECSHRYLEILVGYGEPPDQY